MNRGGAIVLGVVLLALAGLAVQLREPAGPVGSAAPEATTASTSTPAGSASAPDHAPTVMPVEPPVESPDWPAVLAIEAGVRVDPSAWAPLPDEKLGLDAVFADLSVRADAGDPVAACRLAMELFACDEAIGHLRFQEQQARRREDLDPQVAAELVQSMEAALARTEGCSGVGDLQALTWRYGRQAARAGNVAAMELYVQDASRLVLDSTLPVPELKRILAERDTMLLTAFLAGSEVARNALLMRFGPHASFVADPTGGLDAVTREQVRYVIGSVRDERAVERPGLQISGLDVLTGPERAAADAARVRLTDRWQAARQALGPAPRVQGANTRCTGGFVPAPDVDQSIDWRGALGLVP